MIAKKSPKADLERKRFAFFQIGLILAGAMCLAAFEYSSPVFASVDKEEDKQIDDIITEIPRDIIFEAKPKKQLPVQVREDEVKLVEKLPPVTKKSKVVDIIDINVEDLANILDPDADPGFTKREDPDRIVPIPDRMPEFPGGYAAMSRWISKNLNIPDYAFPVSGTIYVRFVVDKNGQIKNVSLSKGIDDVHDKAALAVVKKMPQWIPGEQAGKPVNVRYDLPIKIINH